MSIQRVVIIGATGSAYKRTIKGLANSRSCKVVAIQGRDERRLREICSENNINSLYTDPEEMLSREDYDAVFIGTPPFLHLENIELAAKYSKTIICEKPLARNYEEGKRIASIVKVHGLTLMVAHHLRHQQAIKDIKQKLDGNSIGKVVHLWAQWGFELDREKKSSAWKLDPNLGGEGSFYDAGIHIVDLTLYILGMPNSIYAHGFQHSFDKSTDNITAILEYQDCTVVLNASQTMRHAGNHLLIFGAKGKIEVLGGIGEHSIKSMLIVSSNGEQSEFNYDEVNLYQVEVENMLTQTTHNGTSVSDALDSLKIVDTINESVATGERIYIKNDRNKQT